MAPEPPPHLQWLEPWERVEAHSEGLVQELLRELRPGHVLQGLSVAAAARRVDCDDVLFATDNPAMPLAVVHLTWSGQMEPIPESPYTTGYKSWDDWIERCLLPDHREYRQNG